MREPIRNVDAGGCDFSADGNDLRDSVRGADGKTCPGIEVLLRVNSEGAGHRMDDRHLRQHIGHDQGNAGAENIGKNHGRAGEADGNAASQKQPDADGAANGHHGELPLAQTAMETFHFRHGKLVLPVRLPPPNARDHP